MSSLKKSRYSLCVNLLNSFTEKEIEGLTQLISCRYFNTDKYVLKLFKALKKHIIGKCEMDLNARTLIYNKVFEDGIEEELNKPQQGRLYAKLNSLTRLCEEFLTIQGLRNNQTYRADLLSNALLSKNQYWLFNRHQKKVNNLILNEPGNSMKYNLLYKQAMNKLNKQYETGEIYNKENSLRKTIYNFDLYYLITKLGLQITALSIKRINKEDFNESVFKAITSLLSLKQYSKNPLIIVQQATINLLIKRNEESFKYLLEILNKYKNYYTKDDLRTFYSAAVNFCAQQLNIGKFGYDILMNLYERMHKKKLLADGNFLSENTLKNMVTIAIKAERLDWAKKMSEYYLPYIRQEIRNSVYHFNVGKIVFYQKKYSAAIDHFIKVDHINLAHDVSCKGLILRSHYELDKDYDERTVTIFRSAEKFFTEHKTLPKSHKREYKNFVHILTNLYRVKHRASKMSIERIKASIEKSKINIDKAWLNEKMKELE